MLPDSRGLDLGTPSSMRAWSEQSTSAERAESSARTVIYSDLQALIDTAEVHRLFETCKSEAGRRGEAERGRAWSPSKSSKVRQARLHNTFQTRRRTAVSRCGCSAQR